MKFTEAISLIQKSGIDDAEAIAQAITDYADNLTSDNDKEVKKLTKQIDTLTQAIGIETGTTEEKLKAAQTAISTLTTEKEQLTKDKESLTSQLSQTKKQTLIRDAASVGKASAVVLEKLITDEEVKTEGDKVTVNDKPLKEWAEATHPAFVTALFPETITSKAPTSPPTTKSQGTSHKSEGEKEPENKSVVESYMEKTYKVPSFLK